MADDNDVQNQLAIIRSELKEVREILLSLELNIDRRCIYIGKLGMLSKQFELGDDIARAILREFEILRKDIQHFCRLVKEVIHRLSAGGTVVPNRPSVSGSISIAGTDERKFSQNLRAVLEILDNFDKENQRLTTQNKRLHEEIKEAVNVGLRPEAGTKPNLESILDLKAQDITFQAVIQKIEYDLQNIVFKDDRSLSRERMSKKSFEMVDEDWELTPEDWIVQTARLKTMHDAMTITDTKIISLRALVQLERLEQDAEIQVT